MNKAGLFQKVSFKQFYRDLSAETVAITENEAHRIYEDIRLPERIGKGTARYSFFIPYHAVLKPGIVQRIPTGINAVMKDDWFLACFSPAESLGRNGIQLAGGFQVVGSSYRFGENEGHIISPVFLGNESKTLLELYPGEVLCRAVFLPFGVTFDDARTR